MARKSLGGKKSQLPKKKELDRSDYLAKLRQLDHDLSRVARKLAEKGAPSSAILTETVSAIKDLSQLLRKLSKNVSACRDNYEEMTLIAGKWQSYVAYHGGTSDLRLGPDKSLSPSNRKKELNRRRSIFGKVVSTAMDKTVTVEVARTKTHPLYGKRFKRTKKYLVHDEDSVCSVGDVVLAVETRPLSKRKRHRLFRKVSAMEGQSW